MAERKPLPSIGVDKYTFFPLLTDTAAETTYGAAESLPGLVEIAPTDSGGTATFDADNGAYAALGYLEKPGHEITNADIPPEVDAKWRGLELENGMLSVDGSVKDVYFGVAWRILKADGTYRYVRYYKGTYGFASSVAGKTKPSSGSPEYQTSKATYTAVSRDSDGGIYSMIDEADLQAADKAVIAEKWFTDMDWKSTVSA